MASQVDHAQLQAVALPDLTAPEKATAASKTGMTEDKTTFSDARGLDGSFKLPDVSSLQFVKGEAPAAGKPCAVLFWGKYAKGDYRTMVHVSYLMRALPELQVLGVSCDPDMDGCASMLKKNGTPMPTQSIDELIFDMSLAFDTDKKVRLGFPRSSQRPLAAAARTNNASQRRRSKPPSRPSARRPRPDFYSSSTRRGYLSGKRSSLPPGISSKGSSRSSARSC